MPCDLLPSVPVSPWWTGPQEPLLSLSHCSWVILSQHENDRIHTQYILFSPLAKFPEAREFRKRRLWGSLMIARKGVSTLMASSWSICLTLHYRRELVFSLSKNGAGNGVKEKKWWGVWLSPFISPMDVLFKNGNIGEHQFYVHH